VPVSAIELALDCACAGTVAQANKAAPQSRDAFIDYPLPEPASYLLVRCGPGYM
jgi:hypothetical protein